MSRGARARAGWWVAAAVLGAVGLARHRRRPVPRPSGGASAGRRSESPRSVPPARPPGEDVLSYHGLFSPWTVRLVDLEAWERGKENLFVAVGILLGFPLLGLFNSPPVYAWGLMPLSLCLASLWAAYGFYSLGRGLERTRYARARLLCWECMAAGGAMFLFFFVAGEAWLRFATLLAAEVLLLIGAPYYWIKANWLLSRGRASG